MRLTRARYKWPAVVAAGLVLAGGGTAYAVTGGEETPDYRTVAAGRGDVEETLALTGLVDAANRSDLAFGTSGTVARVKVAQGDQVEVGQVIATLETESLDAAVTKAQASLAQAKAQLESDRDAQSSSVQDASADTGGGSEQPQGNDGTDAQTQALLKKLRSQQQAVLDAQSEASGAIKAAKEALAAQTAACASAYGNAGDDAGDDPGADAGDDPGDVSSGAAADTTTAEAACDAALVEVQAKQAVVEAAQDALATALQDLTATLGKALGEVSGQGQQATTPSQARTSADTPSSASSGPQSNGQTVTAAQLASDQAQIDQAEADLIGAKAARSQATLRSTRSGTVASLDLAPGDDVSAGTAVAVVIGGKAVTLTGTVSESTVGKLKVGQAAKVSVPGSSTTTAGTVTAIGMTADSSTGTTSYPVTITVEDPAIALPTGSRAQIAIVLATAKDVVTLPISAITRNGGTGTVRVWNGSTLRRESVTLGAIGTRTIAITDGIEEGDEVVLADADRAITGASSELNERGGFGPGGGPPAVFRQGGPAGGGPMSFSSRG